jgi:hypothetical protein
MNKLQDMKEEFEDIRARFDGTRLIEFCLSNFDWLIQEVEKLREEKQRLKGILEDYKMKYENTGAIFGKRNMLNKIEKLEKENNLYKQALEEIVYISTFDHDMRFSKAVGYGECIRIAQKALESDSE